MSLRDKMINQSKLDMALAVELSDLSYRSIEGKKQAPRGLAEGFVDIGSIPFENAPKNEITKEMIKEFQNKQREPYIDPATGDKLKYYPSAFKLERADLIAPVYIDFGILGRPATEADITTEANKIEIEAKKIETARNDKKIAIDKRKILREYIRSGKHPSPTTGRLINLTSTDKGAYNREINNLGLDINRLTTVIVASRRIIQNIPSIIEQMKANIAENIQMVDYTNQENKLKVTMYEDDLKALNRNYLSLEQEPTESQEQYLDRINQIELEKYDTILYQDKAILDQSNKFLTSFKEIVRKDDVIENIVKSYTGEQIFLINKHFASITQAFLAKYGFNNTNLTTTEIVDEITSMLDKILNPTKYEIEVENYVLPVTGEKITLHLIKLADGSDSDIEVATEMNSLYLNNTTTGNHVYFKIGDMTNRNLVFHSKTSNSKGQFIAVKEKGGNPEDKFRYIIQDYLQLDNYIFQGIFKGATNLSQVYDVLKTNYDLQPIGGIKKTQLAEHHLMFGWGIKHPEEEIPKYSKFGNVIILLNKLFYKNILSVKTKSLHTIDGLKNTPVSESFVEIIMLLSKNQEPNKYLISNLKAPEKELFNSLLVLSGLHKKIPTDTDNTIQNLKNHFKLCEGEILSGNNNPEVKKELKDTLLKLYHLGVISLVGVKKYLTQFKH